MITFPQLLLQLRLLIPSIFIVLLMSCLILGSLFAFHWYGHIHLSTLTDDVTSISQMPVYAGFLSQIGIFFWAGSIAICFFSAKLVIDPTYKKFFMASGFISMLLGLDDLFLLHEHVFPAMGIGEKLVYMSYAIIMLLYGIIFFKTLIRSRYLLFAFAIGFFGLSMIVDNVFPNDTASPYITKFAEDGGKFVGILFWTTYFYVTGIIHSKKVLLPSMVD